MKIYTFTYIFGGVAFTMFLNGYGAVDFVRPLYYRWGFIALAIALIIQFFPWDKLTAERENVEEEDDF